MNTLKLRIWALLMLICCTLLYSSIMPNLPVVSKAVPELTMIL
jgi:hypothetical protein